jgi:DNA repair exonuclease SbcCD ATPase subunit
MASAGQDGDGADPADVLFAAPLAEFIATRGRLASELSKAGDKQAAAAMKAIGKPSVSAWAVNQAVRTEPAAVHRLIRASDALARAQLSGAQQRDRFQEAQTEHRQAVDALVDLALQVLRDAGQATNPTLRERITSDLRWGALSEEFRPALVAGRLIKDIGAQDFGSLVQKAGAPPSGPFVVPAARPAPPPKTPPAPTRDLSPAEKRKAEQQAHKQARQEKEAAKQRQEELRALWQEARAATREAHKAEARALAELDRHRREVGKLDAALAEARAELAEAEAAAQRAESARRAAESAEQAADQARQAPDNDNHGQGR